LYNNNNYYYYLVILYIIVNTFTGYCAVLVWFYSVLLSGVYHLHK